MRFQHPDGSVVHLAYCSNVHPAQDLAGVLAQLAMYAGPVRQRLGVDRLGLGLWLARPVASALAASHTKVARLRKELERHGLEVVTLNGFPYQGFHDEIVKYRVYRPDWSMPDRLSYTLDLARVLTRLLPSDVDNGSISTLPLAWREPWEVPRARAVRANLTRLTDGLEEVAAATGRKIRVAFEPEPGCVVENCTQAAEYLAATDPRFIGVCLDACHLAVGFEEPVAAVARLTEAGVPVVKLQASCALQALSPATPAVRAALASFAEPRFLHQTREQYFGQPADDLEPALAGLLPGDAAWRVHFHVPLHAAPESPLDSTQDVLIEALTALVGGPVALTHHIEVESYTWDVLPGNRRPRTPEALVEGIAAEVAWTRDVLVSLGLREDR